MLVTFRKPWRHTIVARPNGCNWEVTGDLAMAANIRISTPSDATDCGRIIFEAFRTVAQRHGFAPDFPSAAAAIELATVLTSHPRIFGVVAELEGKVVGSSFLWERDVILGLGPVTVEPGDQGAGVGRQLMSALLERAQGATGVRLVQDAFNAGSVALYASLGFVVREPLLLLQGKPEGKPVAGVSVRPLSDADVGTCETIATTIHGYGRGGEVRDAVKFLKPLVVERDGRIRGYMTMPTFWPVNHAVAETDQDLRALVLGAAAAARAEPLSLLVPARRAELLRWCLSERFRVVKAMTLMTLGAYQEPKGAYLPSVLY
jgi:predicted N-acetyltransferase YhbS